MRLWREVDKKQCDQILEQKVYQNVLERCPNVAKAVLILKQCHLIAGKSHQNIGLILKRTYVAKSLQNNPIWTHWKGRQMWANVRNKNKARLLLNKIWHSNHRFQIGNRENIYSCIKSLSHVLKMRYFMASTYHRILWTSVQMIYITGEYGQCWEVFSICSYNYNK